MSEIQIVEGDIGLKDPTTMTQDEKDLLFESTARANRLSYSEQIDLRWLIDYNELLWTNPIESTEIAMRAAISMDIELNRANIHIIPRFKFGVKSESSTMFSVDVLGRLDVAKNILMCIPAGALVGVTSVTISPDGAEETTAHIKAAQPLLRIPIAAGYGRLEELLYHNGGLTRASIKVNGETLAAAKDYKMDRATFESLAEFFREDFRARLSSWKVIERMRPDPITPPRTKIVPAPEEKPARAIELEKISGRVFAPGGRALIADIYLAGLLPAWFNPRDKDTPTRAVEQRAARAFAEKNKKIRAAAARILSDQKMVIVEKFGEEKLTTTMRKFAVSPKGGLLAQLTDSERKVVEAELATREKYMRAVIANKCAHVRLVRAEPTPDMVSELEGFVGNAPKGQFVQCKVCHFDLICPHLLTKYRMQTGRAKESELRAAIAPYSSTRADNGNIYCNLCGEIIFVDVAEYTAVTNAVNMDDEETNEMIWSEALLVMRAMKFPAMIVLTKFVGAMKRAIYSPVNDMFKRVEKSKTSLAEEIKAKKKIYTAIYVTAWMIKFALENKSLGIGFKDLNAPAGKELPAMIKRGVEILVQFHNITLKQTSGMDSKFILESLITAFKSLSGTAQVDVISHMTAESIRHAVESDTIIDMLYRMDCMTTARIPKRGDKSKAIERLLGGHKFESPGAQTAHARRQNKQEGTVIFANAARPKLSGERAAIIMKSWADMLANIKSGLHLHGGYVNIEVKRGGTIETKMTDEYAAAIASYEKLRVDEAKLDTARAWRYACSYSTPIPPDGPWEHFPGFSRRRIWTLAVPPLGASYDEAGREHKWTVAIFADGSERKIAEINASGAPFDNSKVVDLKCGICNLTREAARESLDAEKVRAAIEKREMAANLFRFYSFRCPKAEIHNMKDGACTLCGYTEALSRDPNSEAAAAYFTTYRAHYVKNKAAPAPPSPPVPDAPPKIPTPEWSFNFDIILELSTLIGVNHRVLAALGGFEKVDFKEVTNGSFIAPEPEDKHSLRLARVASYAQMLNLQYNQLRNLAQIHNPPKHIAQIVDDAGLPRSRYKELSQVLEPFDRDFLPRIHQFWREHKPRDTFNFVLQSICEKLLAMIRLPGAAEEFVKIFTAFAQTFITKIIAGEELLTKPGYFNWSLIYATKSDREESFDADDESEEPAPADDEEDSPVGASSFDVEAPEEGDDDPQDLIKVSGIDL